MVCKRCGRSFNVENSTCPFCGVGQENQLNIRKLGNELEKLKMEEKTSSFNNVLPNDKPILDIEDIIDDLEELKFKDDDSIDEIVPHVEPVSDEELIELISDIKENKELFVTDRSQYQYIPKKEETRLSDNRNDIGINDLINKQRLYYPDDIRNENKINIELPEVLKLNKKEKNINYKKEAIISSIIFVFVAIVTGLFVYKISFSPKTIFLKQINSGYSQFKNIINEKTNTFNELLNYNDISVNNTTIINSVENNKSNKEIINIKYIENKKEKSQYYEYTNLNSIKAKFDKMLIKDNMLFINKENSTNEFYNTDARFISILNRNNKDNIDYLFNMLLDNVKDNLKHNNFKIKKYSENNKKYKETTLTIDEKLYYKIYTDYLNEIKNDDKAMKIITENYQYSNVELITKINDKIKEIDSTPNNFIYKVYTNEDNKVVRQILEHNNTNVILLSKNKQNELKINVNGEQILYLNIENVNTSTNKYNIIMDYDNYRLYGNYYEEDNKVIFNYQKNYSEELKKQEIINLILTKGKFEDKKYSNNVSIAYQKSEKGNITNKNIKVSNILEVDTKIPEVDITNSQIINNDLKNELKEKFSIFIK